MTTPRDDIAGLIERLWLFIEYPGDVKDEAATQLDALSARVKELDQLYSEQIDATVIEMDLKAAMQDRALRAEQERDELKHDIERHLAICSSLVQERDEAYERAAGILKARMSELELLLSKLREPETRHAVQGSLDQLLLCLVGIRLASGPEKIAAANNGEEG